MRIPVSEVALQALASVRAYPSLDYVGLRDALVALAIDDETALDILDPLVPVEVEIPDIVTLADLAAISASHRQRGLEVASAFLRDTRTSLQFVMFDLRRVSRFLTRWVYAEAVEAIAAGAHEGKDQRIAERLAYIRDWAQQGYDPTRVERHRIAMFDRTSRFASRDLATILRGAAQDDDSAIGALSPGVANKIRERLAYACMGFVGVL